MGLMKKITNKLYKVIFGVDLNKQDRYIQSLENQIAKLKKTNINLKKEVQSQKLMLHECNKNLQKLLTPMNNLITFKLYFGVDSRTGGSRTNFEVTFRGIVPKYYDVDDISKYFDNETTARTMLLNFGITWLDYNNISDINVGGYDSRLIEDEPTEFFDIGMSIDGIDVSYPNQKVNNEFID